jgi:transcriptional regulator with XRE-family HTH domain
MTNMSLQALYRGAILRAMRAPAVAPLLAELARRLKALREEKNVPLQEVYDVTGIHVARIEANRLNVTITTLDTLCQYYGTTMADLLQGIEAAPQ